MPGIAKLWNEFATNAKIKDLDKKIEANKGNVAKAKEVTSGKSKENKFSAKGAIAKINERKQLMDDIANGR
jgi:hypothetical protein